MSDKEKLLIEQRTARATQNNFRGLDGKFGIILKTLGHPVVSEDHALYSKTEWSDVYYVENDNEDMPTADIEISVQEIGKTFDGLKFGAHLEITYLKEGRVQEKKTGAWGEYTTYSIEEKVLTVSYKSYPVYVEIDGNLHQYLPGDWENEVNRIYELAVKVRKQKRQEMMIERQEDDINKKKSMLTRLRERWGI